MVRYYTCMNAVAITQLAPLGSVCVFLVCWFFVVNLIALISGWHKAAKTNRAEANVCGQEIRFQTAKIGVADYSLCLVFATTEEGLFMRAIFPFRPGHAPLFFPRNTIFIAPSQGFLRKEYSVTLTFEDCPDFKVTISKKLARKLFSDNEILQE